MILKDLNDSLDVKSHLIFDNIHITENYKGIYNIYTKLGIIQHYNDVEYSDLNKVKQVESNLIELYNKIIKDVKVEYALQRSVYVKETDEKYDIIDIETKLLICSIPK